MSRRRLLLALGVAVAAGAIVAAVAAPGSHKPAAPLTADASGDAAAAAPRSAPAVVATSAGTLKRAPTRSRSNAQLVARLTPGQLLGQRIIYAYAGPTPPAALLAAVQRGEAAGVIFFAQNVADRSALRAAIRSLKAANRHSPVHQPLLLMTDQEGGLVRRLPGPPGWSERRIGASSNAYALASQAGAGAGANLAGIGMNVNLAPVVDVLRARGNFIDSAGRSYGSDPRLVARLAARFITAQQRTGVAATAKHFPGLGAATLNQNTDALQVTLSLSAPVLRSDDELPYRSAIAAGAKLVMTSWAVYPALDRTHPAGLSRAVIGGELRGRLGYRGIVITDELGAGALGGFGTIAHRAALAAAAGADLLLCSVPDPNQNTPATGAEALQGLLGALKSGRLSRTAAEQAAGRVISLRASLG